VSRILLRLLRRQKSTRQHNEKSDKYKSEHGVTHNEREEREREREKREERREKREEREKRGDRERALASARSNTHAHAHIDTQTHTDTDTNTETHRTDTQITRTHKLRSRKVPDCTKKTKQKNPEWPHRESFEPPGATLRGDEYTFGTGHTATAGQTIVELDRSRGQSPSISALRVYFHYEAVILELDLYFGCAARAFAGLRLWRE
jgi:hypothetical protein